MKKYKILVVVVSLVLGFLAGKYLYIILENFFYEELAIVSDSDTNVLKFKDWQAGHKKEVNREEIKKEEVSLPNIYLKEEKLIKEEPIEETQTTTKTLLDIPFTPQAPFAEWADPIYQDGCEEASSLMVVYWALSKSLTRVEAKQQILAISNYQIENYGEYRDTSSQDTIDRIIKGYFGYDKVEVKREIVLEDIIEEVNQGKAVIVPINGQLLGNPYYTLPGPERHMLVIRGYDEEKKEFITNDSGTRKGELYRYNQEVLYEAIRDYLTGYHEPIDEVEKVMMMVRK